MFSKNNQTTNFMKFLSVKAGLFFSDGRTEKQTHDAVNGCLSQFCERA